MLFRRFIEEDHLEEDLRKYLPREDGKAVEKPAEAQLRTKMWALGTCLQLTRCLSSPVIMQLLSKCVLHTFCICSLSPSLPRIALFSSEQHPGACCHALSVYCRSELLQKVQAIQRVMQDEPVFVKTRGGRYRDTANAVVRDPNLEAANLILQELENEHEFL